MCAHPVAPPSRKQPPGTRCGAALRRSKARISAASAGGTASGAGADDGGTARGASELPPHAPSTVATSTAVTMAADRLRPSIRAA